MNDLADTEVGNDTVDYPRALYAPHPILSGLVTKKQLLAGIAICQVLDLAIMLVLIQRQDWWIAAFALGGLFLSWAYTAPPLRLKKVGLGELDVLITVGSAHGRRCLLRRHRHPAVAGARGRRPCTRCCRRPCSWVSTSTSCPTTHRPDEDVPVLIGARAALWLTQAMMVVYYLGVIALVVTAALPVPALLTLLAVPLLVKTLRRFAEPEADRAPADNPVWPLWYAPLAFLHTRRAGGLLITGLLGWAIWLAVR
jgi:1,4-dihydroxy-2-naphthoate octaprenyltransferase